MKYLKNISELNKSTYFSAVDKAMKFNQQGRAQKIMDYTFHEFKGLEINDSKVRYIYFSGTDGLLIILLIDKNDKLSNIIYYIKEDKIDNEIFDRKSARNLSKIILSVFKNSKYKNLNNFNIKQYKNSKSN